MLIIEKQGLKEVLGHYHNVLMHYYCVHPFVEKIELIVPCGQQLSTMPHTYMWSQIKEGG